MVDFMRQKERFPVMIDGREYTIVGHYSQEHIEAVTELVNQQLSQLQALDPHLSMQDRALLMAINAISDQLLKEQRIMELESQMDSQGQLTLDTSEQDAPMKSRRIPFERS